MLLVRLKRCADSLQCYHLARGCAGGSNTNCDPYIMWSGSSANVSLYYYFAFSGGSFSQSSYAAGQPFSVRCCLIGVFSAPAAAFTFALAATHCVFWACYRHVASAWYSLGHWCIMYARVMIAWD